MLFLRVRVYFDLKLLLRFTTTRLIHHPHPSHIFLRRIYRLLRITFSTVTRSSLPPLTLCTCTITLITIVTHLALIRVIILTILAVTMRPAERPCREAFTVPFLAPRLLTVAAYNVHLFIVVLTLIHFVKIDYSRPKGVRVFALYVLHYLCPYRLELFSVLTILAGTVRAAVFAFSETLAVQFKALRVFAVAGVALAFGSIVGFFA